MFSQFRRVPSREFTVLQNFPAGSWTEEVFTLPNVPPTDLGYVRIVRFETTGIRLSGPR